MGVPVRHESVRADMLARYRASFITNSSTFGRPLSAIGEQSFLLDPDLDALLLSAYELTPFETPQG